MIQAMYSGIAGLSAFKSSLDVIGNNIANVSTVSYKAGRVTFKEALSQTVSGATSPTDSRGGTNPVQLGLGVVVGAVDNDMSVGSPTSTGLDTDLMIAGEGYFVMSDGIKTVYTRDGAFSLDANNNLVSSSTGLKVLGWQANSLTGDVDTSAPITSRSGINIPVGLLSTASATTEVSIGGNLNNSETVGESRTVECQVYDSLGELHKASITFTKAENSTDDEPVWDYEVTCPDVSATDPVTTGSISFDSNGCANVDSIDISLTFADSNGSVQPLDFKLDTSGISSISGDYTVSQLSQNGLSLGTLESFTIGQDGVISGTFTNGSSRALAQISIAAFTNPAGLSKLGNNTYSATPNSGSAQLGTAGSGGRGSISAGYLEASNVDLAREFASMIVAQRGFQANSRIITVADEVLENLVTMVR